MLVGTSEQIIYARRDPNENDWKTLPPLFINKNTDCLFIKGQKGWIKIPTEYSVMHKVSDKANEWISVKHQYPCNNQEVYIKTERETVYKAQCQFYGYGVHFMVSDEEYRIIEAHNMNEKVGAITYWKAIDE